MIKDTVPGRYWHKMADGRIQCDLCPRYCHLKDGQRGLCFVRARQGDQMVSTTYGRSSGSCKQRKRAHYSHQQQATPNPLETFHV